MDIIRFADIALGYLYDAFVGNTFRLTPRKMPQKIGKFRFIRDLQPDKNYPFKVGLYKDLRAKLVVVKMWEGKRKNIHYFDLLHQIETMKILNLLHEKLVSKIPRKIKFVSIPKFIDVIKAPEKLMLISEYIDGKPLASLKESKKHWEYYQKSIDYLKFLGEYANFDGEKKIKRRTIKNFLTLFPLLWLTALVEHPGLWLELTKALAAFLRSTNAFYNYNEGTIVHGDLNLKNIYISGKRTYILDVEQTTVTYPEFELVTSLSTLGITNTLRKRLFIQLEKNAQKDRKLAKRLSGLIINCEIHNMTWNAPEENILWYRKMLNYGIALADKYK